MTGEELRQAKQRLRREIRIQAARLTEKYRREASERIVRQVLSLPAYRKARTVMAFVSLPGEPDTRPILEDAAAQARKDRAAAPVHRTGPDGSAPLSRMGQNGKKPDGDPGTAGVGGGDPGG